MLTSIEWSNVESVARAAEPITATEAKTHSRVDTSADDAYIATLITSARQWVENWTNRSLVNTTWVLRMPDFPREIRIPRSPLSSITSITYIDTNGDSQTLSSAEYQVNTNAVVGLVKPVVDSTVAWPSIRGGDYDSVVVTYVAGYGAAASAIPDPIKHAVKELVAHLYEHREPVIIGQTVNEMPLAVENLLAPYVVDPYG